MGCPQAVPGARRYIAETARAATTIDATASPRAYRPLGLWPPHQSAPVHAPESIGGPAIAVPHPTGRIAGPHFASLPTISRHSLTLFSKSFSSFPRGTCFAIGLTPVYSLGRNLPPYWGCLSQTTRLADSASWCDRVRARRGSHPLWRPLPGDLGPGPPLRTLLQTTIRTARPSDFQAGLIPVSLAVTKGILVHVHGSFCFAGFDNDPSAGSPTETLLRLLLPLNDKVQWNSRDVAGGEPPTSPRS
ncbi:hypothetical protein L1887_63321 [Cichorium endivia]|nr:hypothetical protein L1887_63321 [Cichorium endivia]